MKKLIISLFVAGIASTGLYAQNQTPVINQTQKEQKTRIEQGVKSGELTKGETKKLVKEQRKIQHDKQVAKADGKVTPAEKKIIKKEQNKANKDIYRMKHNKKKGLPK